MIHPIKSSKTWYNQQCLNVGVSSTFTTHPVPHNGFDHFQPFIILDFHDQKRENIMDGVGISGPFGVYPHIKIIMSIIYVKCRHKRIMII